jgi:hypothetical protein
LFNEFGKSLCLELVTGDGSKKGWVLCLVRQTRTCSEVANLKEKIKHNAFKEKNATQGTWYIQIFCIVRNITCGISKGPNIRDMLILGVDPDSPTTAVTLPDREHPLLESYNCCKPFVT